MQGSWKIKYTLCYSDIKIYTRQIKALGGEGIPAAILSVRKTSVLIAASLLYQNQRKTLSKENYVQTAFCSLTNFIRCLTNNRMYNFTFNIFLIRTTCSNSSDLQFAPPPASISFQPFMKPVIFQFGQNLVNGRHVKACNFLSVHCIQMPNAWSLTALMLSKCPPSFSKSIGCPLSVQ